MRDVKQEETKLEKMVADFVVNQMKMSFEKGVVYTCRYLGLNKIWCKSL